VKFRSCSILHRYLLAVVLSASIPGCSSNVPTNFYLLTPTPEQRVTSNPSADSSADRVQNESGTRAGVRIVTVPEYLNRLGLVTRPNPNELNVSTTERWAEPLADNITRVLISNIGAQCKGLSVMALPQPGVNDTKIELRVSFIRFEREADQVILQAHAVIVDTASKLSRTKNDFEIRKECSGREASDTANCMSGALANLSSRITELMQGTGACVQ